MTKDVTLSDHPAASFLIPMHLQTSPQNGEFLISRDIIKCFKMFVNQIT
jgi:hypothetical protein